MKRPTEEQTTDSLGTISSTVAAQALSNRPESHVVKPRLLVSGLKGRSIGPDSAGSTRNRRLREVDLIGVTPTPLRFGWNAEWVVGGCEPAFV